MYWNTLSEHLCPSTASDIPEVLFIPVLRWYGIGMALLTGLSSLVLM
jgi:hypothetical protein